MLRELSAALRHHGQSRYKQRFSVRMRTDFHLLLTDEGVTFAVDGVGQCYPLTGRLAELERQLDQARFGRLNRSELVNTAFVEKMEPYLNNRLAVKLRVKPEVVLNISAAQTPDFRRWLEGWGGIVLMPVDSRRFVGT